MKRDLGDEGQDREREPAQAAGMYEMGEGVRVGRENPEMRDIRDMGL